MISVATQEKRSLGFPTRFDTNWPVEPLKKFEILTLSRVGKCSVHVAKTNALISCAITAQLNCIFVLA